MARDILINDIRIDGDTQVRSEIDQSVVADYADAIQRGDLLPPVVVFDDGSHKWLADGFHRVMAYLRLADQDDILADVRQGTRDDAAWFALGANKTNGHRLTNADKQRAVKRALTMRPGQTDRAIAELIGVHHDTVGKYRGEMQSVGEIRQLDTRTGKDGKQYPARREPAPAAETTTEVVDVNTGEVLADVDAKRQQGMRRAAACIADIFDANFIATNFMKALPTERPPLGWDEAVEKLFDTVGGVVRKSEPDIRKSLAGVLREIANDIEATGQVRP